MYQNMWCSGMLSKGTLWCCVGLRSIADECHSLALEYGLKLLYHATFHELFEAEREAPEFAMLLQKMRVVTAEGESELTEEQWEAASKCTSLCNAYTRLINAQISMSRLLLRGCKALRTCGGRNL
jgi:hypothetical protein